MTDQPEADKVFDMPHARVTLTPIGPNVEIEVWPKAGQSAYAVVAPGVAILIAQQLGEMAVAQLGRVASAMATDEATRTTEDPGEESPAPEPDNIVDLASRRPAGDRAG
jgi:hypothetical protein